MGGLDPDYTAWLTSGHPDVGKSISPAASVLSGANTSSSSDVLGNILVHPKPSQKKTSRKRKPALNSQAVCITEETVFEQLKAEEEEKKLLVAEKKRKLESKQKKKTAQEQKAKKEEEKARKAEEKTKKVAARKQNKWGRKAKS